MVIVLPSGRRAQIDTDQFDLQGIESFDSISAWLVAEVMCYVTRNTDYGDDEEDEDEGENGDLWREWCPWRAFRKELTELVYKAYTPGATDIDWEAVDTLTMVEKTAELISDNIGDNDTEEAMIEQGYGFEGEGWLASARAKDGKRMRMEYMGYEDFDEDDEAENCENLTFVVTGKLKFYESREAITEFIEEAGGRVSETISKSADYLICNDVKSNSAEMKKAKELGVTVLTEAAFIRKFSDPEEFKGLKDTDKLHEEFWKYTYSSGAMKFMIENGLSPIYMEVWKDGKWVSASEDKK